MRAVGVKQYRSKGFIMHDEKGTQINEPKQHYVPLAQTVLPGYYVMRQDTRDGVSYQTVRVDYTMFGDGTKQLKMYYSGLNEVPSVVSDNATFFGPLPLE